MLPFPADTTCDIYRAGNAPPSAPNMAGVVSHLVPCFERGREAGEGEAAALHFTHLLYVELATDMRDDFGEYSVTGNADTVYVPDQSGIPLQVVFVERVGRGGPQECKKVYLDRKLPTWPLSAAQCGGAGGGSGVMTNCCMADIPTLLHVTVSSKTGTCTCLPNALTLTWNGSAWSAGGAGTCTAPDVFLICSGSTVNGFLLYAPVAGITGGAPAAGSTCSPFDLVFSSLSISGCCNGTATFHVTE